MRVRPHPAPAASPAPRAPASTDDHLVVLDANHPGFRDRRYRRRRDLLAQRALAWRPGQPVPRAPYTRAEHAVWHQVLATLRPLHARWACREVRAHHAALVLPDTIPQLSTLNRRLRAATGFVMAPVAGLVAPRHFLEHLAQGIFLSTQYIRHHSRPLYTPEPDVVHELVGHAPSLMDPRYAALSRAFGRAAQRASEARLVELERLYWFTLEFGVVREGDAVRACGAGLLSGAGELASFARRAQLLPFDAARIARTPYDPTGYQRQLFVADAYERILRLAAALDP